MSSNSTIPPEATGQKLDVDLISELGLATDNIGGKLSAVSIVLSSFAVIIVAGRIYGRAAVLRIAGWDDAIITIATMLAVALTVAMGLATRHGLGGHSWYYGKGEFVVVMKYSYAIQLLYIASIGATRVSLILQILRITAKETTRKLFSGLLIAMACLTLASLFAQIFICGTKFDLIWASDNPMQDVNNGNCREFTTVQMATGCIGIVADIVVWLSPLSVIWKFRIKSDRRWLLVLFMVGAIIWIAAVVRLVYIYKVSADLVNNYVAHTVLDPGYTLIQSVLWTSIEVHLAIICGSIPTLRPFMTSLIRSRRQSVNMAGGSFTKSGQFGDLYCSTEGLASTDIASQTGRFTETTTTPEPPYVLNSVDSRSELRIFKHTEFSVKVEDMEDIKLQPLQAPPPPRKYSR